MKGCILDEGSKDKGWVTENNRKLKLWGQCGKIIAEASSSSFCQGSVRVIWSLLLCHLVRDGSLGIFNATQLKSI